MYKLATIIVLLIAPFTSAQNSNNFQVVAISSSYNARTHKGKTKWILTEEQYMGLHPCSLGSVCACWLEHRTFELTVDCSSRNLTKAPVMYKGLVVHYMDLSDNQLQEIPNMTDEGYDMVQRLNLNNNRIESIDGNAVSENLEVLLLMNNQISRIDRTVLDKIQNASKMTWLDLGNNPLICDCKIAALVGHIGNSNIPKLLHKACEDAAKQPYRLATNAMCPGKLAIFFKNLLDHPIRRD